MKSRGNDQPTQHQPRHPRGIDDGQNKQESENMMGKMKEQRAEHGPTPESLAVEQLLSEWRYFDNGGKTADRYSCDMGPVEEGVALHAWLGMSSNPFDPQGIGMHDEGCSADELLADDADGLLGAEVAFADLPEPVQRCIRRDAIAEVKARG